MTTKKVFFILPNLNGGGAERVVLSLVTELHEQAQDTEVTLVVFAAKGAYGEQVPKHIRLINLAAPRARHGVRALWRLCRAEKPDVVISTMQASIVFGLIRRWLGYSPRWIARMENPISLDRMTMHPVARWLFARSLAAADTVVCLNHGMQADVIEHTAVRLEQTVVIPNPIDVSAVRAGASTPVTLPYPGRAIVMCGRLVEQKNYPLALAILQALEQPDVHLYILGEGALHAELVSQANAVAPALNVHFVGFKDNPYAWMAAADVFLLTSHYEGFGNVIVEALASGVPVVSADCPTGPATILSALPYTALVPVDNVPGFVSAVTTVLQWSQHDRAHAIAAGQKTADQYQTPIIAAQYIAVYS